MFSFYGFYQLCFHDFLELSFDEFFRQIEKVWHFCFHQFLWQFDLTRKIQLFGNSGNSTKFSWKRFRYLKEIKTDIRLRFDNKIVKNIVIWRIFCFFYRWASRAPCRGPPVGALPPAATVPAPPSQRPKMSTTSSWSWSATRGWANPAYWRNF